MKILLCLASILAFSNAMVCFKGICDHLKKPELNCKGGVIKNGGVCGCYDVCAKSATSLNLDQSKILPSGNGLILYGICREDIRQIEGEVCQTQPIRGRLPLGTCAKGLTCVDAGSKMMIGTGICQKRKDSKPVRSTTKTLCEQRRIQSMISMVVYKGQWFPKCDAMGNFMPQQCDNTGMCFCVDANTGTVDESSKVLGAAEC